MARMKPEVMEQFLARPIIGVLAVSHGKGAPYQVPVWFLWKDGVFWLTGTHPRMWCRLLKRHPRASLCIEDRDPVSRYVAVTCDAEPVGEGIWPVSTELARKYVGKGGTDEPAVDRFMANMRTEPRLLFRLTPRTWRAIDLTVYTGIHADSNWQKTTP